MQQLGPKFIENFLLPYIKDRILGNIEQDTRLQNLFKYDAVIRPTEIDGLIYDYFQNTNTFLDTDLDARDLFWKEFIEFVKTEKGICSGDVNLLANRLLPDFETGRFSQEAENNLRRFSHYYVKAEEKRLIDELIKQREASGQITADKARDLRLKNQNDELVLARSKKQKGDFDIIESEEIRRALDNVEKQAGLMGGLFTEIGPRGEEGFLMNPLSSEPVPGGNREQSSSMTGFQEAVWEGQKVAIEKKLANNGFILQGSFKVNKNGSVRGEALDQRSRTRLVVEFSLTEPYPEGQRRFRITFADNPRWRFLVKESELENFRNRPVSEIYAQKRAEEKRKTDMPPTGRPIVGPPIERLWQQEGAEEGEAEIPRAPATAKTGVEASEPIMPEATRALAVQPMPAPTSRETEVEQEVQPTGVSGPQYATLSGEGGVREAKEEFERRRRVEAQAEGSETQTPQTGLRAAFNRPGVKVAAIYGTCAAAGGIGLFWTVLT